MVTTTAEHDKDLPSSTSGSNGLQWFYVAVLELLINNLVVPKSCMHF